LRARSERSEAMRCSLVAAVLLAAQATGATNVASRLRRASINSETNSEFTSFVQTGAKWRFGTNYVPQHYGSWKFKDGVWNFGADRRIECEACGYVMYMLVDRLGDNFSRQSLTGEMEKLCPRVQWVFKSACDHILTTQATAVVAEIMRLSEPEDICKKINLCTGDMYDKSKSALQNPMIQSRAGGVVPSVTGFQYGPVAGGSISVGHPQGFQHPDGSFGPYPAAGTRPLTQQSPYSQYSFGGYDHLGYPQPHPGVPSSTPLPPEMEHPPKGSGSG